MTAEEYAAILEGAFSGEAGPELSGFQSKKSKSFAAKMRLKGTKFRFEFADRNPRR